MKNKYLIVSLIMFIICGLSLFGCSEKNDDDFSPGSFEMLFTDPEGDEELLSKALELVQGAENSIYIESYGMDLDELADALIDAHQRGVSVAIACEGERYNSATEGDPYWDMSNSGIPITPDTDNGAITHDKVMIIDSTIVWTGSANFTENGYYWNNNNVLIIESRDIALSFLHDFSQMFAGDFHTEKTGDGADRYAVYDGSVEVWFSPQDSPVDMLIQRVDDAQQSIEFAIYAFTLSELADALISARDRGVDVRGIFDEGGTSDTNASRYDELVSAGMNVKTDPCPYAFHHKFMVIDVGSNDPLVITGSGNFSIAGTHSNDENFVVIHSSSVAQDYHEEFMRWW